MSFIPKSGTAVSNTTRNNYFDKCTVRRWGVSIIDQDSGIVKMKSERASLKLKQKNILHLDEFERGMMVKVITTKHHLLIQIRVVKWEIAKNNYYIIEIFLVSLPYELTLLDIFTYPFGRSMGLIRKTSIYIYIYIQLIYNS